MTRDYDSHFPIQSAPRRNTVPIYIHCLTVNSIHSFHWINYKPQAIFACFRTSLYIIRTKVNLVAEYAKKKELLHFPQSHIQYEVMQSRSWIRQKEAAISFSTRQWATLPSTITSWSKTIDGSAESIQNFLNRNRRKRSYYFIFQTAIFNRK